ncbi:MULTISPECIES: urease accessory protein UreD [unclassified Marinobacterium]|uniref:urease accessory protein UreD n=1 Tax=unclassified Marinobacterium TaxID=2644139 RepID=UPI001568B739|nr:Urease accessory protein UreD [Marinobacterium sp. xm-d-420]NRP39207.1 Urease accessory protein UreD [Marinobacterium sp. xm-a-121]NRP52112.1 Urease accessory protein UreD [Marinobacterium sp. xm-v-242]NRP57166.1 Urease accessory protein UreD [Marinobacterium sp. xm-d-510]NRP76693.1 Urease accessory protein UreD [Marinobacterium sp. xm-m-383]NRP97584.1 Urease accessory protein UreD [Marinobacterium sp. xm-a-127]NRQ00006.1 Urease accessory protein UreD [Marinobacterium sp. xm-v-233]
MNSLTGRQGWHAELTLGYQLRGDKTRLVDSKREGPLAVQRAFYPEGEVCHTYLLHPPGGVVAGDDLNIDLQVSKDAKVLLTTPGATKFYRSIGPVAEVSQRLTVAGGGSLEWMPLENIFFPGTQSHIVTEVHLEAGAHFIGWEINCFGRPSNEERFETGQLSSEMRIYRDGEPVMFDRFATDGASLIDSSIGLKGVSGYASMVATVDDQDLLEQVQQLLSDDPLSGATLMDGLLVVRTISEQSQEVIFLFSSVWRLIRPQSLGKEAAAPRIWAT